MRPRRFGRAVQEIRYKRYDSALVDVTVIEHDCARIDIPSIDRFAGYRVGNTDPLQGSFS